MSKERAGMSQLHCPQKMFAYDSFGMRFNSMLELPGLSHAYSSQLPDVMIRLEQIPHHLPDVYARGEHFEIAPNDCLLIVPGIGRYRITSGYEITIEPAPNSSPDEVRAVIYSAALGVLFHQRELVPIHASAIVVGQGCLAFAGPSHAGKSTLVSYLMDKGFRLVTDDVCLLSDALDQHLLAYPGLPFIRLRKDALQQLGKQDRQYRPISPAMDKYQVAAGRSMAKHPLPLLGIVQIGSADRSQIKPFQRLCGLDAIEAITEETFWSCFIHRMGKSGGHFLAAVNIASRVPIYRCNLPRSWERMDAFQSFITEQFGAISS